MWSLRTLLAGGLAVVALSACGSAAKPSQGRGRVDDPRTGGPDYLKCIRDRGLSAVEMGATGIQIGQPPAGPTIRFLPTPGAATAAQIAGNTQGAEVIGAALLYPNAASNGELQAIESCLGHSVKG
ncbi:MAG: hypothetical protein E6G05_12710 [Actinobacteria bacterium]|jgi:hypothetical protein|nr:MAG: hypothetical protein E6G05_12710 [Actinomycetota bacterium]